MNIHKLHYNLNLWVLALGKLIVLGTVELVAVLAICEYCLR